MTGQVVYRDVWWRHDAAGLRDPRLSDLEQQFASGMCEGVRRRGLVGLVRPALTGRHRQSLELPCRRQRPRWCALRRRRAAFYAPCRALPPAPALPHRHSLLAGLVGEVVSRALSGKSERGQASVSRGLARTAPAPTTGGRWGMPCRRRPPLGSGMLSPPRHPLLATEVTGCRSGGNRLSCSQAGGCEGGQASGVSRTGSGRPPVPTTGGRWGMPCRRRPPLGSGTAVAATPPFTLPAGGGHRVPSGGSRLSCSQAGGCEGGQASGSRGLALYGPRCPPPAVAGGCRVGGGRRWGRALRRRHATLYAPRRRRSPGAVRWQPTLVLAGWGGEGDAGCSIWPGTCRWPRAGWLARGVGRGRYRSGGCVAGSRVTSVVPRWSRRNW